MNRLFKSIKNFYYRSLISLREKFHIVKKMDYRKSDIFLHIESEIDLNYRLHSCEKEPETVAWIESFGYNEVFYDIGANVGVYSLVAAKSSGKKLSIYSFEPAFQNYPQLCRNIILNQCDECISPFQIALSDSTSLQYFHYHDLIAASSHHTIGEPVFQSTAFKPVFRQPVLSFTIDDLVKKFKFPCPNHVKIDVDGNEVLILHGMRETLNDPHMQSILVEVDELSKECKEIVDFLQANHFRLQSKHKYVYEKVNESKNQLFNYIFVRV